MTTHQCHWEPNARAALVEQLRAGDHRYDLIVVGGGITGAGIYHEAAAKGLKVLLIEQKDFAWGTSSRSSKMVHGGLRYLASGQFGLARDAVRERQALLNELPGLVEPLPFMMGHYKGGFPGPWVFDKVLAIYDWMAGKRFRQFLKKGLRDFWLPGLRSDQLLGATRFADAVTDDARLVMRVLHAGNQSGGHAINYLKALSPLVQEGRVAGLRLHDEMSGVQFEVAANVVVSATGAWTDALRSELGQNQVIRPLRGSHLVVAQWRLPVSFSVSFLHPDDKRPVFAFPWEGVTVIGTTDLDHQDHLSEEASISVEEVDYLLRAVNQQFPDVALCSDDVISTWSGVRPVVSKNPNQTPDLKQKAKPSDEKREHAIWEDQGMLSVAGGKLTTYRLIAQEVLERAAAMSHCQWPEADWSSLSVFSEASAESCLASKQRMIGRYGEGSVHVDRLCLEELDGQKLDAFVASTQTRWAELAYACCYESIVHLDDLLLRRTRLGLLLPLGGRDLERGIKRICQHYLSWDEAHWQNEWSRYQEIITKHYALPGALEVSCEARKTA